MESGGTRTREAGARGNPGPAAQEAIRSRRRAALWPGQVVSGRVASALGAGLLVASRRRAGLERRLPARRRHRQLWARRGTREALRERVGGPSGGGPVTRA